MRQREGGINIRVSLYDWCIENGKEYLLDEWNYEKNVISPKEVGKGPKKKVWWKCKEGHEWESIISNRVKGVGCPYCSGKKALEGFNDLRTINPKLASEWNHEKNGNLKPCDVTKASAKKVWWKCSKNHEWESIISNRAKGVGCPYCSGKKVLEGFNDLGTANPKLISEWDFEKNKNLTPYNVTMGSSKKVWWKCSKGHSYQMVIATKKRGRGCPYCAGQKILKGFNDLATTNPELASEWNYKKNKGLTPSDVMRSSGKKVWWECKEGHEWEATMNCRSNGRNCPYCSGQKVLKGFNDLATTNPELISQWDYEKNVDLTPYDVPKGSERSIWWKCKENHEWKSTISNRAKGIGCPYCSGLKAIKGINDLATLRPELATEWNFKKNGGLTPNDVKQSSGKKVWWKCKEGHEWEANINSRLRGNGCPYCSGRYPIVGENDLATTNPELISQWNYEKNKDLKPYAVMKGSNKKVWWKCKEGHEWKSSIYNRTKGNGCPYCSESKGEKCVEKFLSSFRIDFIGQNIFKSRGRLRDDFALAKNNLIVGTIEYHGKQHYEPVDFAGKGEKWAKEQLKTTKERDKKKSDWLKEHDIPQLIIPYWDYDKIPDLVEGFLKELNLIA